MQLIVYPLLKGNSKKATKKDKKNWGKPHFYRPRMQLIKRLQHELGWSQQEVLDQIYKERKWILSNKPYYV